MVSLTNRSASGVAESRAAYLSAVVRGDDPTEERGEAIKLPDDLIIGRERDCCEGTRRIGLF